MAAKNKPISWTEIKTHVPKFSTEWVADSQSFWNDFFDVSSVRRRTVAAFEAKVRNIERIIWLAKN